jgi:hypothetical protein
MTFPVFSSGEVLRAQDMNAVGLWLVKSQTITGTPSSTVVSSAFSSDYDHYRIVISNLQVSVSAQLRMTFGSTVAGYYYGNPLTTMAGGAYEKNNGTNVAFLDLGSINSNWTNDFNFDVFAPNKATLTKVNGFGYSNSAQYGGLGSGLVDGTTQYTAFTITCSGGTMSAGTIQVFGYRKP